MFMRAVHPGQVLKDELDELGITPTEFSRQIEVPPNRVSQIIGGKRSITGDTALRFGHWFGMDPQFWLNLQAQFDLVQADKETGETIRHLPTRASLQQQPILPQSA
jgi:addiction module HigA family antidote